MYRLCAVGCAVAACGLAGWAAYIGFQPPAQESSLAWEVEEPERDLGELPPGTRPLTWKVSNRAAVERRVIGLAEG